MTDSIEQSQSSDQASSANPKRDTAILIVAGQSHDDWRAEWRRQNGDQPRIKKTTDVAWSTAHGDAFEVDIAATAYADLPSDWQGENKLGAEVAVDEVFKAITNNRLFDGAFIEEASAVVHAKWVERHKDESWIAPELKVPYAELAEGEKEKDRLFIRRAIEAFRMIG